MMFVNEWAVLLVDDEPDVLSVSRLVMRNFRVYGLPLRIYTAPSKAAAQELLQTTLTTQQGTSVLAVAFIDVVMETDQAGLELCQFIREEQRNQQTQLFIRTGQPGTAPERQVIDRYEINGYFTKVEATEDKLYSLVKSGVRHYYTLGTSRVLTQILEAVITQSRSREKMANVLSYAATAVQTDTTGGSVSATAGLQIAFIAEGKVVASHAGADPARMLALRDRLEQQPATTLSSDGDRHMVDGKDFLFTFPAHPDSNELSIVGTGTHQAPDAIVSLWHGLGRSLATLWKQAD